MPERIHGTSIARGNDGVLLLGPPGAGKSDLALRCMCTAITYPPGPAFQLVSDDQTVLSYANGTIEITPPATISGRLEVRGLGIMAIPFRQRACLRLAVRLTDKAVERMPDCADLTEHFCGLPVKRLWLNPFEASAPAKVALALHSQLTVRMLE